MKARADLAALRGADGDVLQVRVAAAQPPGGGHRLVEVRVHAPVRGSTSRGSAST